MRCQDIMTKFLKMCRPECTVLDAVRIMKEQDCGAVPVVNENTQIAGIVTDRDITMYTILNNKDPKKTYLKEFMSQPVITCHANQDVDDAIAKMKEHKIRRIPIVDDNNKLIGMVSLGDVAVIAHEEHETFEALEEISSPVSSAK